MTPYHSANGMALNPRPIPCTIFLHVAHHRLLQHAVDTTDGSKQSSAVCDEDITGVHTVCLVACAVCELEKEGCLTAERTASVPCQVLNGSATVNDVPSFTRNFSVVGLPHLQLPACSAGTCCELDK